MFVHVCACACSHLHRWTWRGQRLNQMSSSFVLHHSFWDSISYWTWSFPVWLNWLARESLEFSCASFPSHCTQPLRYMGWGLLKSDPHVHKVNTLLSERLPVRNVILKQELPYLPYVPFCLSSHLHNAPHHAYLLGFIFGTTNSWDTYVPSKLHTIHWL